MTLLTKLQKWRELRSKATQGEWVPVNTEMGGLIQATVNGSPHTNVAYTTVSGFGHTQHTMPSAQFIAQAPSILQALEESVTLNQEMREALIDMIPTQYAEDSYFGGKVIKAQSTLTRSNELLGETK